MMILALFHLYQDVVKDAVLENVLKLQSIFTVNLGSTIYT